MRSVCASDAVNVPLARALSRAAAPHAPSDPFPGLLTQTRQTNKPYKGGITFNRKYVCDHYDLFIRIDCIEKKMRGIDPFITAKRSQAAAFVVVLEGFLRDSPLRAPLQVYLY